MSTASSSLLPGGQQNALSFLSAQILNPPPKGTLTTATLAPVVAPTLVLSTSTVSQTFSTTKSTSVTTANTSTSPKVSAVTLASAPTAVTTKSFTSTAIPTKVDVSQSVISPSTVDTTILPQVQSTSQKSTTTSAVTSVGLPSPTLSTSSLIVGSTDVITTVNLPNSNIGVNSVNSATTLQPNIEPAITSTQTFPKSVTDDFMGALPTTINYGSQGGQLVQNNVSGYSGLTVVRTATTSLTTTSSMTVLSSTSMVAPIVTTRTTSTHVSTTSTNLAPTQALFPLETSLNYGSQGGVLVENSYISGYTTLTVIPTSIIPVATTTPSNGVSSISRVPFPTSYNNTGNTSKSSNLLGTMIMGGTGSLLFATPTQGVNVCYCISYFGFVFVSKFL